MDRQFEQKLRTRRKKLSTRGSSEQVSQGLILPPPVTPKQFSVFHSPAHKFKVE